MKINLLITSILATGALALPLCAQTSAPDSSPAATEAASPAAAAAEHFGGKITAIDTTAKTITVASKKLGSKTFKVTDSTTFAGADGSAVTLTDLKVGDRLHGGYTTAADGSLELGTVKVGGGKPAK
jgi:hypothetical protein